MWCVDPDWRLGRRREPVRQFGLGLARTGVQRSCFVFIGLRLGAGLGERADDILHGPERRSCDANPQLRRIRTEKL